MSRTVRKRQQTFESYYHVFLEEDGWWANDMGVNVEQKRARYYSKTEKWYSFGMPRWFRNRVNRDRRRHDKREIWKAVNKHEYEELCSSWNCKDNNSWGYW